MDTNSYNAQFCHALVIHCVYLTSTICCTLKRKWHYASVGVFCIRTYTQEYKFQKNETHINIQVRCVCIHWRYCVNTDTERVVHTHFWPSTPSPEAQQYQSTPMHYYYRCDEAARLLLLLQQLLLLVV